MVTLKRKSVAISPDYSKRSRRADLRQRRPPQTLRCGDSPGDSRTPEAATGLAWSRVAALASRQNPVAWTEGSGCSFSHVFYSASCFYAFLLLKEKKSKFTCKCVCARARACTCFAVCLTAPPCSELGKGVARPGFSLEPPHHASPVRAASRWRQRWDPRLLGPLLQLQFLPHSWHLACQSADLRFLGSLCEVMTDSRKYFRWQLKLAWELLGYSSFFSLPDNTRAYNFSFNPHTSLFIENSWQWALSPTQFQHWAGKTVNTVKQQPVCRISQRAL